MPIETPPCFSEPFCLYNIETDRFIVYDKRDWGRPRATTEDDIQDTESCRLCYAAASVSGYEVLVTLDSSTDSGRNRVMFHNGRAKQALVQHYDDTEERRFVEMSGGLVHTLVPAAAPDKVLVVDGEQLVIGDSGASSFVDVLVT